MLLAQDPQLLLVDEPAAGMTDAETAKTARLLREINRTRTVVVVEHDMDFVRALGCESHGAARRVGAGRRPARSCQRRRARDRSLSGEMSMLAVENVDLRYGAAQVLWKLDLTADARAR